MKEKVKIAKYIGETSRSGYDRGYEHLDKLASLSSDSHMLKHMVDKHQGEDLSSVKWGMFIIKFLRTAFERQILEAVTIQQESENHDILNSRSEWNQVALPRLTTRAANIEDEIKEWEKQLQLEKENDSRLEARIREMRKSRNKARLNNNKQGPVNKKQKIEQDQYINIRNVWGAPTTNAPVKHGHEETEDVEIVPSKKVKINNEITETSVDTVENIASDDQQVINDELSEIVRPPGNHQTPKKIVQKRLPGGPEKFVNNKLEEEKSLENTDWDTILTQHQTKLENELIEKQNNTQKDATEQETWTLYEECKQFLEENEKNWQKKKIEREIENKRQERISRGKEKQDRIREKVRERNVDKEIEKKMSELPKDKKKEIEHEEERKKRLELQNTRKDLWKLRSKEKKYERKSEKVERLERIKEKENKLENIKNVIEEMRLEKEKLEKEIEEKKKHKNKKENEKKIRLEKQRMLGERWAMLRWVTDFIKEHHDEWVEQRINHERKEREELEEWKKAKRFDKIKILKRKWNKENHTNEKENQNNIAENKNTNEKWEVWRKKEKDNKTVTTEFEKETTKNEGEETLQYNMINIIEKPRLEVKEKESEDILPSHFSFLS